MCVSFLQTSLHNSLTFGLSELVEHHHIQGVVEVLGQRGHVVPRVPVGAVDGLIFQVSPVHAVLQGHMGYRQSSKALYFALVQAEVRTRQTINKPSVLFVWRPQQESRAGVSKQCKRLSLQAALSVIGPAQDRQRTQWSGSD